MLREDYGGTSPDSRRDRGPDAREVIVPVGDAGIDPLATGRKDVALVASAARKVRG